MKIICVAGGSYKSFYINYFLKIHSADLVIFNYGLIYDYVTTDEIIGDAIVTKELMFLSKSLKAKVVAGIYVVNKYSRKKAIIYCDGDKINISSVELGAKIVFGKYTFVVGDERTNYRHFNKIILSKNQIKPNLNNCSKRKVFVFLDKFGVNFVQNHKMSRNFNKYSKIILK